jgi:general secretion pathway protein E
MELTSLYALFPRPEAMYFHSGKLIVYLLFFLLWIRSITWINGDARIFSMPQVMWVMTMVLCMGLSLAVVWMVPHFGLGFLLFLMIYCGPFFTYVAQRNAKVPPPLKVFTPNHLRKWCKKHLGFNVGEARVAGPRAVPLRFIGKMQGANDNVDTRMEKAAQSEGYRSSQELVYNAIHTRSTDIHMEPTREAMVVRYRIDGILTPAVTFDTRIGLIVLNVYKNLAGMDIAEKRKPQDGSFSAEIDGNRLVDFRVATSGSVNGEKLVMRILDSSKQMTDLTQIGMKAQMRQRLDSMVQQSYGMLVTCGPTGAGKTSTLYACMNMIDRHTRNVITLENPVEYLIDNVTQIEVNPKAGKTFAAELRSILRQDPDVILIGEIRDVETAEIACQAAQTGHMVFTTLHANDTITAIGRLIDLGVKPFLVASSLSAVLGQRLVRTLCPKCKVAYKPTPDMLKKLRLPPDKIQRLFRAKTDSSKTGEPEDKNSACEKCGGSGYLGRTGIFELLVMTDEIRELVKSNPDMVAIKQKALEGGWTTLLEDGIRKVAEGATSLEEVQRVAK